MHGSSGDGAIPDQADIISPAGSPATTAGNAARAVVAALRSTSGSASTAARVVSRCRQIGPTWPHSALRARSAAAARKFAYVWGRVDYIDAFGRPHFQTFQMVSHFGQIHQFVFCQNGNATDDRFRRGWWRRKHDG
jgi:hypothetical protein